MENGCNIYSHRRTQIDPNAPKWQTDLLHPIHASTCLAVWILQQVLSSLANTWNPTFMNILSAPLHMFPWESFSSRTLSISISGNCRHSSMFHCSYIYKCSLVVCGSRYCTELSQNSCVHLLCSACKSSAALHVYTALFMALASALHVFIVPASVVCTSIMNTLIAQWISCISLLFSIWGCSRFAA